MSLKQFTAVLALLLVPASGSPTARAEKPTRLNVRVISTTFVHSEVGAVGEPLMDGGVGADTASPLNRLFTDLRTVVRADEVSDNVNLRLDGRIRAVGDNRTQSGKFGGSEYDLRDGHAVWVGRRTDVAIGRQTVQDIAATKIDGFRITRHNSRRWRILGFGGLYPARGSRSLATDYPSAAESLGAIAPLTGGIGAGYQTERAHGSFGVAGILPTVSLAMPQAPTPARVFASSQGYWRPSGLLDLYHYTVVDLANAGGPAVTNLSAGAELHPRRSLRLSASVNHIDIETLDIIARSHLDDPDTSAVGVVQNNVEVARISSDSVRGTLSLAVADNRFEISTSGALRRRPEVEVARTSGDPLRFPQTQTAELSVRLLDRRGPAGFRLSASATAIMDTGHGEPSRSDARVARLSATRPLGHSGRRGQWELDVAYLHADDQHGEDACTGADPLSCYGTAATSMVQVGGMVSLRFGVHWLLIADVHFGQQQIASTPVGGDTIQQPNISTTTGFLRLEWRL